MDLQIPHGFSTLIPQGEQGELRAQLNRDRRIVLLSGTPVANLRSETSGVSARVCRAGSYGFASAPEVSEEALKNVLKKAEANAAVLDRHLNKGKAARKPIPRSVVAPAVRWTDAEQSRYLDYLRELDAWIATLPNLTSRRLVVNCDSTEKHLVTGDGAEAHTAIPRCYVYVNLVAETKEGAPVDLFKAFGGFGGFDDWFGDPAALRTDVEKLHAQLMEKREGVYAKAGKCTCILGGELSGMLAHEAVGHTVEADLVIGGSVAGPNLNKIVASPLVSMTDFAYEAFGQPAPLPVYCDDEGVEARDVALIRNGVLVGFMHDRESAERFGMEALGNARAYSFSDEPLIRMRNTAVHPGKDKLEDIIASVDDGYYLINTNNGQADTTGEFMFGVTLGYEIKKGKLGKAILDTTISGVAFDMLKTVDMVSDEVIWSSSGFCGKKQPMAVGLGGPALRCQLTIGGR